jgi:hypothetical protein
MMAPEISRKLGREDKCEVKENKDKWKPIGNCVGFSLSPASYCDDAMWCPLGEGVALSHRAKHARGPGVRETEIGSRGN